MNKQWHDMTELEYQRSKVTSYIGGATWIRTPWNTFWVAYGTPVDIRKELKLGTVRVEVFQQWHDATVLE